MKDLADAVAAADSAYSLIAIAIIGLYVLLWRHGGRLLDALHENTRVTKEAKEVAEKAKGTADDIAEQIITNHGSKNLGDAVDRITEWLVRHMEEARASDEQLKALQQAFLTRYIEIEKAREDGAARFENIDEQLAKIREQLGMKEE